MMCVETVKTHIEYCVVETDMIQLYRYYIVQNDVCRDCQNTHRVLCCRNRHDTTVQVLHCAE